MSKRTLIALALVGVTLAPIASGGPLEPLSSVENWISRVVQEIISLLDDDQPPSDTTSQNPDPEPNDEWGGLIDPDG